MRRISTDSQGVQTTDEVTLKKDAPDWITRHNVLGPFASQEARDAEMKRRRHVGCCGKQEVDSKTA